MKQHTITAYRGGGINDADETEHEFVVTYTISKGRPATGPSYASGGEPAEPDEIELLSVTCDGIAHNDDRDDDWLIDYISEHHDFAAEAADRADYLCDRMRDEQSEFGR